MPDSLGTFRSRKPVKIIVTPKEIEICQLDHRSLTHSSYWRVHEVLQFRTRFDDLYDLYYKDSATPSEVLDSKSQQLRTVIPTMIGCFLLAALILAIVAYFHPR